MSQYNTCPGCGNAIGGRCHPDCAELALRKQGIQRACPACGATAEEVCRPGCVVAAAERATRIQQALEAGRQFAAMNTTSRSSPHCAVFTRAELQKIKDRQGNLFDPHSYLVVEDHDEAAELVERLEAEKIRVVRSRETEMQMLRRERAGRHGRESSQGGADAEHAKRVREAVETGLSLARLDTTSRNFPHCCVLTREEAPKVETPDVAFPGQFMRYAFAEEGAGRRAPFLVMHDHDEAAEVAEKLLAAKVRVMYSTKTEAKMRARQEQDALLHSLGVPAEVVAHVDTAARVVSLKPGMKMEQAPPAAGYHFEIEVGSGDGSVRHKFSFQSHDELMRFLAEHHPETLQDYPSALKGPDEPPIDPANVTFTKTVYYGLSESAAAALREQGPDALFCKLEARGEPPDGATKYGIIVPMPCLVCTGAPAGFQCSHCGGTGHEPKHRPPPAGPAESESIEVRREGA